ncbi:MAG TPA: response regulator [Terriglobales bacterium]|nr:response regulator [Terriglobales bacterium]
MARVALVVDDSMLIRHSVCRFLEERGFVVEAATNGVEALEILQNVRPDLIITDLNMPKMTGSELITALNQRPDTASIPVVVVAGRGSSDVDQETRAKFVIYKDIDIDTQLEHAIAALIAPAE